MIILFAIALCCVCASSEIRVPMKRAKIPLKNSLRWRSPKWTPEPAELIAKQINGGLYETDYFDNYYVAEVGMGTPPQISSLVMDTGSSNLWVMDRSCPCGSYVCDPDETSCWSTCKTPTCCAGHNMVDGCNNRPDLLMDLPIKDLFDPGKSSTYKLNGTQIKSVYGKGSAIGLSAQDTCTVAGIEIKDQDFFSATVAALVFSSQPMSGMFGLAYPILAAGNLTAPVINMVQKGLIDKPIFSVWMQDAEDGEVGGEIVFGGIDTSKYTGDITYIKLTQKKYWQYKVDQISFEGSSYNNTDLGYQVISDTGTSFTIGPPDVVDSIAASMGARENVHGVYIIDCSKRETSETIDFMIDGKKFSAYARNYVVESTSTKSICILGMQGQDLKENMGFDWILGDSFMRSFYHVFDLGEDRVGLALAVEEKITPSTTSTYKPSVAASTGSPAPAVVALSMIASKYLMF